MVRIGMGYKAVFAANSSAIGKKSNAVDRPSPRCHRPQGVMQAIPRGRFHSTLPPENNGASLCVAAGTAHDATTARVAALHPLKATFGFCKCVTRAKQWSRNQAANFWPETSHAAIACWVSMILAADTPHWMRVRGT